MKLSKTGFFSKTAVWILSLGVVGPTVTAIGGWRCDLIYRTVSPATIGLAYDERSDQAVELNRRGEFGPSVLRRVRASGEPTNEIWRTEMAANCAGSCAIGLEYSRALGGYVLLVELGNPNWEAPYVYFTSGEGGTGRLLARGVRASRAHYPEAADRIEANVVGFRDIESVSVADSEVLINGARGGDGGPSRTYVLDIGGRGVVARLEGKIVGRTTEGLLTTGVTKGWKKVENDTGRDLGAQVGGVLLIPAANKDVLKIVQSGDRRAELRIGGELTIGSPTPQAVSSGVRPGDEVPGRSVEFQGCGTDRPRVTGVWPTKRGTFMVAVDCAFNKEQNGRVVYGGLAHCLYEVQ